MLSPWTSRRRQDLLDVLDRLNPTIDELSTAVEQEAKKRPEPEALPDTHPIVILSIVMNIVKHVAAIAKGMSVTFIEMFGPTIVENHPDVPRAVRCFRTTIASNPKSARNPARRIRGYLA